MAHVTLPTDISVRIARLPGEPFPAFDAADYDADVS
jgi:hypothetical protein